MRSKKVEQGLRVIGFETHESRDVIGWFRIVEISKDGAGTQFAAAFEKLACLCGIEEGIPFSRINPALCVAVDEEEVLHGFL